MQNTVQTAARIPHFKSFFLTGTALAAVSLMPTAVQSAACTGQNTSVVTCNNITTLNAAERTTSNSFPTTVTIGPGFVLGFGVKAEQVGANTTLTVTNTGTMLLSDPGANGLPVLELRGDGGTVTYTGSGSISNSGLTPSSTGLFVSNSGDISVSTSGPITGDLGIHTVVAPLSTANVTITNTSTITGNLSEGILTQAFDVSGSTTINNFGTITTLSNSTAIHATGDNSSLVVNNTGNIVAGFRGIVADYVDLVLPTGDITINSPGNITSGDTGIFVISDDGVVTITANNVNAGFHGINTSALNGNVTVETTGTIIGGGGAGVFIDTGGGVLSVRTLSGSVTGVANHGIFVTATTGAHPESNVSVVVDAGATVTTLDPTTFAGIAAQHFSGNGNNNIVVNGSVLDGGILSDVLGTGTNTVSIGGSVTNTVGTGLVANTVNGLTTITNSGLISGVVAGMDVKSTGSGSIGITNTGTVAANGGSAIVANSGNDLTVTNSGGLISGAVAGLDLTSTGAGSIVVSNTGTVNSTAVGGSAVIANSGNNLSLTNFGNIIGSLIANATGAIGITNNASGVMRSVADAPSDLVVTTTGGPATLTNAGLLTGRLSLGGASNLVNNTGTWSTAGLTTMGGNLNNGVGGTLNMVANGTTIAGVSNFDNLGVVATPNPGTNAAINIAGPGSFVNGSTGSINLQNGSAGDRLTINGNYVGVPGSQLRLDFASQNSSADQLLITGNATGATAISVFNVSPGAPFSTSPNIVQVNGTLDPGTFALANALNFGPLDLILISGAGDVAGSSALSLGTVPNALGLAGLVALQGAQAIAFQSNSTVLDRMQEIRDLQRRSAAQGVPLNYAEADPQAAYAAALPKAMKAAPEAPAPRARLAAWGRAYGDVEERNNNIATFNFAGIPFARDLSYDQRGGGLLAGADVVLSNLTSAQDALIIGAFGGYITSNVDLKNVALSQDFSGGSAGFKATYVHGNFFADAVVKADFLSLDMSGAALAQSSDLINVSALGNVGYKFDFAGGFYVEPTAGVEYVSTDFSESPLLTATTVPLVDGHVLRLRAGARFGTEWVTNNIRIEPSILPLIYYVADTSGFENFTAGGPAAITFPGDEGKVFGEIQASVNFFDLGSGLSGFIRSDLRFGEDLIGGSGKAGIRFQW